MDQGDDMKTDRQAAMQKLAIYLTEGSRVAGHSIALQIGGARKAEADAFFALRDAFGVRGYDDRDAALRSIKTTLDD
jgi:hypothetical protein